MKYVDRVWVVDDDRSIRFVLKKALQRAGIPFRIFERGELVLLDLREECPSVLLSDIRMPGISGVRLLKRVKERVPDLPVIIMTAFSDVDASVASFQGGAFEYLAKPFDIRKAIDLIRRAREDSAMRQKPKERSRDRQTNVFTSQASSMQEIIRAVGRLSQSIVSVLITGASGTGKEVLARSIWEHSPRSKKPYVAVNMAAIPAELLESELFGHEKGSFTGATTKREGRFGEARGGTIFLDEIGDMPMELQTRLLRVLSSGFYYRVGGVEPIQADVRVIAATNQNLEERVKEGLFREDLFHRLNVIRLRLPDLKDRKEDIVPLAKYFLRTKAKELGVEEKQLTEEAAEVLSNFAFPGNVRQLENLCQWLLVMAPSAWIKKEDLPEDLFQNVKKERVTSTIPCWEEGLRKAIRDSLQNKEREIFSCYVEQVEQVLIKETLLLCEGNKKEAAEKLGIGRNTLMRKLE